MGQLYAELYAFWAERLVANHLPFSANPLRIRDSDLQQGIPEALSQVDAALHLPWSVARIARLAHMSPGHLHRCALHLTGKSPMEHVTTLRMLRAEALLTHSNLAVYEIAERVGYTNPFAFSTAFKRHTGKSPSDYRNQVAAEGA